MFSKHLTRIGLIITSLVALTLACATLTDLITDLAGGDGEPAANEELPDQPPDEETPEEVYALDGAVP
jgi:hypothetical protein